MSFKTTISVSEFTTNRLRVVSLVPLQIQVVSLESQIVESFQTSSNRTEYQFTTPLSEIKEVIGDVIPGFVYEFYPVIQAL